MKEGFEIKEMFDATPAEVYHSWLDSESHTQMTGGVANCSKRVGASFSAWDGYITGENIELVKDEKIVQTWRTSEFSEADEDSLLTIILKNVSGGTELTLIHTNIPEGQTQYKEGWVDNYFLPMKAFFET